MGLAVHVQQEKAGQMSANANATICGKTLAAMFSLHCHSFLVELLSRFLGWRTSRIWTSLQ